MACALPLALLLGCLDVTSDPPVGPPPAGILPPTGSARRPAMAAALHLHAWSNHSGNSRPASMAWLAQQYSAAGVDVLWWTDHAEFFLGRLSDFVVTPLTPQQYNDSVWIVGKWGYNGQASAFLRTRVVPLVDSAHAIVELDFPSGDAAQIDTVELFFAQLFPFGIRRAAQGVMSRPLVGQPRFTLSVWTGDSNTSVPSITIRVPLAWHPRSGGGYRQFLHYRWDSTPSGTRLNGDTLEVWRSLPTSDSMTVTLDPATDAAGFPDGLDNTTDAYRVRFSQPRSSPGVRLRFSFPRIANQVSTAAVEVPAALQLSHALAQAYGVRTLFAMEVGPQPGPIALTKWYGVSGAGAHLTFFYPGDLPPTLESSLKGQPAAYSALANLNGGITSIAHPFGTSGTLLSLTPAEEKAEAAELGAFLVQNGGWGASLIEIGLVRRGGVGIRAHLDLLDYLWASGVKLCPTAVSDAHGGLLQPDPPLGSEDDHNFVTWIGNVDRLSDPAALITSMRSCDLAFGNPFYTRGGMWIAVGPDSAGGEMVILDVDGVSPSATLQLYEAEIDSTGVGHAPVYRQENVRVDRGTHPRVGGCRAGFARLEAWFGGRPLAFSNVVQIPSIPALCTSPAPRR